MASKRFTRRDILRGTAAAAGMIPLVHLGTSRAWAAEQLDPNDPTAQALKYAEDASTATRPDKAGVAGADQECGNCALYTAPGDGSGPCALFQGRIVPEGAWCSAWAPKP